MTGESRMSLNVEVRCEGLVMPTSISGIFKLPVFCLFSSVPSYELLLCEPFVISLASSLVFCRV